MGLKLIKCLPSQRMVFRSIFSLFHFISVNQLTDANSQTNNSFNNWDKFTIFPHNFGILPIAQERVKWLGGISMIVIEKSDWNLSLPLQYGLNYEKNNCAQFWWNVVKSHHLLFLVCTIFDTSFFLIKLNTLEGEKVSLNE